MIAKILVPIDLSSVSERAIELAVESAIAYGASVVVTAVVPTADSPSAEEAPTAGLTVEDTLTLVQPIVRRIRGSVKSVSVQIVEGDPAGKILELAQRESIDLVVMATHARSGLTRGILGSVTDNVLRNSGIPVLAIRSEFVSYLPEESGSTG